MIRRLICELLGHVDAFVPRVYYYNCVGHAYEAGAIWCMCCGRWTT